MGVRFFAHVQGIIQHATINNLAFGRNVEETLRILQAIQYVQENPDEVLYYNSLCHCLSHQRKSTSKMQGPLISHCHCHSGLLFPASYTKPAALA